MYSDRAPRLQRFVTREQQKPLARAGLTGAHLLPLTPQTALRDPCLVNRPTASPPGASPTLKQVRRHGIPAVGQGGNGTREAEGAGTAESMSTPCRVGSWGWPTHARLRSSAPQFWANIISGKSGAEPRRGLSPPQLLPRQQQASDGHPGTGRSPASSIGRAAPTPEPPG